MQIHRRRLTNSSRARYPLKLPSCALRTLVQGAFGMRRKQMRRVIRTLRSLDAEAAELDQAPLGGRSFRLQQVSGAPPGWTNQKVAAKGFLTRSGTEERVNVTSLRTLTSPCSN